MTQPRFFIYKHTNKSLVSRAMNNLDWESNGNTTDLANNDKLSMQQLKAMQLVARMKEAADKCGAGFVGGFISPTGERFMMSNMDADESQVKKINHQLNVEQQNNKNIKKILKMMEEFEG